ncbi:MFS transporter [Kribbella sp. NBC_00359]|uniref:MFS transporter n=1 Tax=Kribbella sp. NBC_00359 TaxID=2975966 RepID=UPI002E221ECD
MTGRDPAFVADRSTTAARDWVWPGVAIAAIGWGANQFSPLIVLYQQHGVSPSATGLLFALYAVSLVPALVIGGRWSDRIGRRKVVQAAVLLSLAGSLTLILGAVHLWCLYPGRLLAGASSGLGFGAGAAWIRELSVTEGAASAGPRRTTVAMSAGFGVGPLVAGVVAQWAPMPEVSAYLPQVVLAASALLLLRRARAVVTDSRPADSPPAPRRTLPARYLLFVLLPFAPWVFGTAAIALAFLPGLVATGAGTSPVAFAAVATAVPAFAAVVVQPAAARVAGRRLLLVAMASVVVALSVAVWAAATATVLPVLTACIALGAAYGITQFAGLSDVQRVAHPARLGSATAAYQALCYVGFAVPYLLTISHTRFDWTALHALTITLVVATVAALWLLGTTISGRVTRIAPRNTAGPPNPAGSMAGWRDGVD